MASRQQKPALSAALLLSEMRSDPYGWISVSVYESAQLVRFAPWLIGHRQRLRYVLDTQQSDGMWPGPEGYGLVPTLGAVEALLASLAADGGDHLAADRSAAVIAAESGLRALAQRFHRPGQVPLPDTVAVELVVPALVSRITEHLARLRSRPGTGSDPWLADAPLVLAENIDRNQALVKLCGAARQGQALPAKLAHSLESLDGVVREAVPVSPGGGVVACSPAATAAWLDARKHPVGDRESVSFLEAIQQRHGGPVPVCAPVPVFERAWVVATLASVGLAAGVPDEVLHGLHAEVGPAGVAAGTGLAPDADTTATTLYALARIGQPRSPECLLEFQAGDHFVSFPAERTSSTSANAHVLQAMTAWLAQQPVAGQRYRGAINAVSRWLLDQQQPDGYWYDKWHASPYYATLCCALALAESADHTHTTDNLDGVGAALRRAVNWLMETQRADGSWGRWQGTAEETAYAVQILLAIRAGTGDDTATAAAARGAAFLFRAGGNPYPPLWHDKDLYTPVRIVQAAVIAALRLAGTDSAAARLLHDADLADLAGRAAEEVDD